MELLPAVTAWLDSRTRVLKKQVTDLVTDPVGHVEKQAFNAVEDASNFIDKSREDPMAWVEVLAGNGMVGAFRPVGSKLLPSTLKDMAKIITPVKLGQEGSLDPLAQVEWGALESESLSKQIVGKISDKVLQKYGASDFPLDPFLGHVRGTGFAGKEDMLYKIQPVKVTLRDISEIAQNTVVRARTLKADKALEATRKSFNGLGRSPEERLAVLGERERSLKLDLDTLRDSIRYKTDVYDVDFVHASNDIKEGAFNLSQVLETTKYTPEQLSKKSLEQLVSIGKKTEAAQLKEASVIKDFTISRSAQLNKEQGLPKGFVELKTQQDLGAETEFMNNCVGAGGAHPQTGKFLPKWHPITGEQITKGFAEDSGDKYWKRLQSGNERIFSYRPEGLPVATIRMDTRTGNVLEALGVENGPIPESMAREIKRFTDQKQGEFIGFPLAYKYRQMGSMDARRWDVPLELEALLRPHGPGLVQRAEWNRQDNLRRIQQILDDFRQFEAGDWMAE